MKINFQTKKPNAPSSMFYEQGLRKSGVVDFYNSNYSEYNVLLLMSYKEDLNGLKEIKKKYPQILIGILDPRSKNLIESCINYIDFFIVDSLEMKDFFSVYNKPICIYCEYPDFDNIQKKHNEKKKIIIGYHGNKVHLLNRNLIVAIHRLANEFDIEFWAIYNVSELGLLKFAFPENIKVKHIQWHSKVYTDELSKVDIGVVPNLTPIAFPSFVKRMFSIHKKYFLDSPDDYLIRFKMPSNSGRAIIFGKLGIPVVADFSPSLMQLIKDGSNGFIAYSTGGWYLSIKKLILDFELRSKMSERMLRVINTEYDYEIQNKQLLSFICNDLKKEQITDWHYESNKVEEFLWYKIRAIVNRFYYLMKRLYNKSIGVK